MKIFIFLLMFIFLTIFYSSSIYSQTWKYKDANGNIYEFVNSDDHCGKWYQNDSYMGIYCGDTGYLMEYNKVRWLLGGAWNEDIGTLYGMLGNNSLILVANDTGLQYEIIKVKGKKKK